MNILISLNHNYVDYCTVLLVSVCENNKNVNIYIAHSEDLFEDDIRKIRDELGEYDAHVFFCFITKDVLGNAPAKSWSIEVYFRLLAFSFLPQELDRILYLDGDVLVNKNLEQFYSQDFEEHCFIACEDMAISRGKNCREYENVGLELLRPYYNSGVLLINLERMRKKYVIKEIIACINENSSRLTYVDQTVLNMFFYDEIKKNEGRIYNCQVGGYLYTEGPKLLQDTYIFHFCGRNNRPWEYRYNHHFSSAISPDIWWHYARKTSYGKNYWRWKIVNTCKVKPWQIVYKLYKKCKG